MLALQLNYLKLISVYNEKMYLSFVPMHILRGDF